MRVGLLQEGEVRDGKTYAERYRELIVEAVRADERGFSTWGTSEQHFSPPRFTVSAPEVLYAAIAAQTSRIALRIMAAVLLKWNHPLLVAERLATLDIVSGGRAEICTARSNNLWTLEAFGVDPSETAAQWADGHDVLVKALTQEVVEHDGPVWKIPPREIVPRCVTQPHPAISLAASSVASHAKAGEKGIGAICFENYFGFDYLQECIDAYRDGVSRVKPGPLQPNDYVGLYVATAFCADTREEAKRVARDVALEYFQFILDLYIPLGQNPAYGYLRGRMDEMAARAGDLDFLCEATPSVMVGTPDDFVERLRRLEAMGVDEVVMRVDGMPHDAILRSLDLIGAEVIPAVDPTLAVARTG
jgi:alkanesulfonate monooxygenase SsuD/methylene tetrahydromethanopterin reductase-like flavin-dependent oxidoreductase (luciferase family)